MKKSGKRTNNNIGNDSDDKNYIGKKHRSYSETDNNEKTANNAKKYKKPPIARFYDKLFPGEYTKKQDLRHVIILFIVIVIVIAFAGTCFYIYTENQKYSTSAEIVIPSAAYTSGQEDNVKAMLENNGFKNITTDDEGNFHAYGTPERVQNYKNDYYQRTVKTVSGYIDDDYSDYGIVSIYVAPDWSKMTIDTIYDDIDAATITYIFQNRDLNDLIRTYAIWRQINTGGSKMELVVRSADGQNLIDRFINSADEVVSEMQAEENDADTSEQDDQ